MTDSDERDAARLKKVAEGDLPAFGELYRGTSAKLLGICLRTLRERGEAEEALQECYLAIWRKADRFDPERGSARGWMMTLAHNCAVDRLRARNKTASAPLELAEEIADQAPLASELAETRERSARLDFCLDRLERSDSVLIRTAFFQGSTYRELAARANRPLPTIKSRIRRALQKLAECLQ